MRKNRNIFLIIVMILICSITNITVSAEEIDISSDISSSVSIESTYSEPGAYAVSTMTTTGYYYDKLMIYYPKNMTGNHPIITWGNGSWTNPTYYTDILTHLASHGFVIVCSYGSNQGSGVTMKRAANYMVALNNNYYSRFYNKLDISNIAAMGYSQGACGAFNAAANNNAIKTVVSISLVTESSLSNLGTGCDVTSIGLKPVFLLSGEDEPYYLAPPSVTQDYYDLMVENNQPVVKAILPDSGHLEITDGYGPDRFKGYFAAWLMYQLRGDEVAADAFETDEAEILTNPNWTEVQTNDI